jgi:RimJ/RimL family protein N-acetyltransferase
MDRQSRSHLTLADGARIRFRAIEPDDADRLRHAFRRLSPTSRYRRFLAPVQTLSDEQVRTFTHVDAVDHVAWVAELVDQPGRPLAGVARWVRSTHDRRVAEMAITVVDAFQHRGLGRAMLRLLLASAALRGLGWLEATVLAENQPIRALLREFNARQVGYEMGAIVLRVPVPSPVDQLAMAS